jgi:DnaJ-class molecular chaperone
MSHIATCPTCNGRGSVPGNGPPPKTNPPHMPNYVPRETCGTCKGTGEVLNDYD